MLTVCSVSISEAIRDSRLRFNASFYSVTSNEYANHFKRILYKNESHVNLWRSILYWMDVDLFSS